MLALVYFPRQGSFVCRLLFSPAAVVSRLLPHSPPFFSAKRFDEGGKSQACPDLCTYMGWTMHLTDMAIKFHGVSVVGSLEFRKIFTGIVQPSILNNDYLLCWRVFSGETNTSSKMKRCLYWVLALFLATLSTQGSEKTRYLNYMIEIREREWYVVGQWRWRGSAAARLQSRVSDDVQLIPGAC